MVEAKLRVEALEVRNNNNPFYGNTLVKKVTEDILMHDFDKRKNVAPCGIIATIKVGEFVFDIRINRYYFDHENEHSYAASFSIEEKTYEVWVDFVGAHLINITLSEWLQSSYFENGDDADNVYRNVDFTTIDTLL